MSYAHFSSYSLVPCPLGATPVWKCFPNLSVTYIYTTTQNLKFLGEEMTYLCPFSCILTSATPPRCHTPFEYFS